MVGNFDLLISNLKGEFTILTIKLIIMKTKNLLTIVIAFLFLAIGLSSFTLNNKSDKPSGTAYAVTWKNSSGYWFAVGPAQVLLTGYDTEDEAISLVRGYESKKHGSVELDYTCGKFRVYNLGVDYNSYDTDALKYVREKKI